MKRKSFIFFLIFLFIISGSFVFAKKKPTPTPEIIVTIAPYKYFVERLTDSSVKVKNLIPEEADPHGFEPPAKELVSLFSAKAWFVVGEPFEQQFLPVIKKNDPTLKVYHLEDVVSEKLELKCSHHSHAHVDDMHFWMSPKVMQKQVQRMAQALQELYPEKAATIKNNLALINSEFEQYDLLIQEQIAKYKSDYLLVSHPAFGYFCKDYGLQQLALENETQDPSPKDLARLHSIIKDKAIQKIYVQKQHSYKLAKMTANELNLKMVEVNPYKEQYFDNLSQFGSALNQE